MDKLIKIYLAKLEDSQLQFAETITRNVQVHTKMSCLDLTIR